MCGRSHTLDWNTIEMLKTDVYSVDSTSSTQVTWNVIALLKGTNPSCHTVQKEVWYWLTMKQEGGAWKVAEVSVE